MLVRELINVLKNFPRKHIFTLLIGLILIISISLLGNIKFTAEMEESLDKIANGDISWLKVLNNFYHI